MKIIIGVEESPRIQFSMECDLPPGAIKLPDGKIIIQTGRYASKGERYRYSYLPEPIAFNGAVKEWVKYSGLEG